MNTQIVHTVRRIARLAPIFIAPLFAPAFAHGATGVVQASSADHFTVPSHKGDLRVATFNCYLNRPHEGQLLSDLKNGDDQAAAVAEIIQRVDPDILLLNEFDYDADGRSLHVFLRDYLGKAQHGVHPVSYPYVLNLPTNTGVQSGYDLDNNGEIGGSGRNSGNDAYGYGEFPGQYGFVLLSKYPIREGQVRSFRHFLWKDMPGAVLPDDPSTPAPADWYSAEELEHFRLSSKNHVDVPVEVNGQIIHILASHPTPPSFDGPEDRNGRRNHDEIRLWADYVGSGKADYLYDDSGRKGGLVQPARFILLGDQNADPIDGDTYQQSIRQLLDNPLFNASFIPTSAGGAENNVHPDDKGENSHDTAQWGLRADYVLPSVAGFKILQGGVFWPTTDDPLGYLTIKRPVASSDHRLVWLDLSVAPLKREAE